MTIIVVGYYIYLKNLLIYVYIDFLLSFSVIHNLKILVCRNIL
jgi:hypothetical protein